jgi:hypothetical protein
VAAVHIASLLGCEEGGDLEEIMDISTRLVKGLEKAGNSSGN